MKLIFKIIGLPIFIFCLICAYICMSVVEYMSKERLQKYSVLEMIKWYIQEV